MNKLLGIADLIHDKPELILIVGIVGSGVWMVFLAQGGYANIESFSVRLAIGLAGTVGPVVAIMCLGTGLWVLVTGWRARPWK